MIRIEDVLAADEVFLTGTAAEIIGVTHVDDRAIGKGQVGEVTLAFNRAFRERLAEGAPED